MQIAGTFFCDFGLKLRVNFFCDLYADKVMGRQIIMYSIANVCEYKILRFWANPQAIPAKIVTFHEYY